MPRRRFSEPTDEPANGPADDHVTQLLLDAAATELLRQGRASVPVEDYDAPLEPERAARWDALLTEVAALVATTGEGAADRFIMAALTRLEELATGGDAWATREIRQILAAFIADRAEELAASRARRPPPASS